MESPQIPRTLWILLALHFALALSYSSLTPYREGGRLIHQGGAYAADIGAPDERQHVNYVKRLANGEGFPVLNPDPASQNAYENYQAHQPPVFYLAAAGVAKLGGLDLDSRSGGLVLRGFNAAIGAAAVLGVFFFALWGLGRSEIALAAAAFAALLPMNVALSGAVSNDPTLFALCSWTLALAAKSSRSRWPVRSALAIGILMGLAFLTKTTAVALWAAVAAGLYVSFRSVSEADRPSGKAAAAALALPLLIALPWWLRNLQLYGDPLALNVFNAAFAGSPQAKDFIGQFGAADYWLLGAQSGTGVFWWTLRSFFGAFGYMDIFWPKALYWGLAAMMAGIVGLRLNIRKEPWLSDSQAARAMGGVFFFMVAALFLRFNAQYFQGQARYLLPAMAPIAVTVGMGIWSVGRKKPALGPVALAAVLIGLNVYTLIRLPEEFGNRIGAPSVSRPEQPSESLTESKPS